MGYKKFVPCALLMMTNTRYYNMLVYKSFKLKSLSIEYDQHLLLEYGVQKYYIMYEAAL